MTIDIESITEEQIEGLPDGARLQRNRKAQAIYVYFGYNFRTADGGKVLEKDYIGTVRDGKFVPNAYY